MFIAILGFNLSAYCGKKLFGNTQLSPVIPNKTTQGAVIGIAGAMCIGFAYIGLFGYKPTLSGCVISALVAGGIGAVSYLGDLYGALTKRTYNVTNSSNLLLRHGGVLDKVYGALIVAPVAVIMLLLDVI